MIGRPGFLFDEHLGPRWAAALRRMEPRIDIYVVGHGAGPPPSTSDPDLLAWTEEHGTLLVTLDRATMPRHLADHLARGRHSPGVLMLPRRLGNWSRVIEDIVLVWLADTPETFADRIRFLPL